VFSGFDVGLVRADGLEAVVSGEPIDQSRHELKIEVKAATYHELKVEERDGAWAARVIFDV
jgi:SHS2 domain-containing protein